MNNSSKPIYFYFYLTIASLFALLMVFFLNHWDGQMICLWAKELLYHIRNGHLYMYAQDLYDSKKPTNYPFFCNLFNALSLLPVFLFETIFGQTVPDIIYQTWFKFVIFIFLFLDARLIVQISKNIDNVSETDAALLFLLSAPVQIYGIGMGQIDLFSVFFMLLGIRFYFSDQYFLSGLFMGFSLVIKPLTLPAIMFVLLAGFIENGLSVLYKILPPPHFPVCIKPDFNQIIIFRL